MNVASLAKKLYITGIPGGEMTSYANARRRKEEKKSFVQKGGDCNEPRS